MSCCCGADKCSLRGCRVKEQEEDGNKTIDEGIIKTVVESNDLNMPIN